MSLDHFTALPIANGFSYTLASRLGQILRLAEDRYGQRDHSYTPLGVEFSPNGPQLWFPGNIRHVVIQLSLECRTEPLRAYYQLAHETVHLLSPTGGRDTTVLEEGLATYFSEMYMLEHFESPWHSGMESYSSARAHVKALLDLDEQAIKRLREEQSKISSITAEEILSRYPEIGDAVATALTQPFTRE